MKKIELLSPAKDLATAITAIGCGADAVYIGGSGFSARQSASNDISEIKKLTQYAHQFYVKIYAAVNTLVFDNELAAVQELIESLYQANIDGIIIQDTGILKLKLPDIPIIASTQMDNSTPEHIKFLEDIGFSRVILARELNLKQIIEIRKQTSVELECFIHGALCVGQSGKCYMSHAIGSRSGNRGNCAQPCRNKYSLKDKSGNLLAKDRYLLSVKDLNLSSHINELIDAGITSFKIEGRLKNQAYVANITGYYRQILDNLNIKAASSGKVELNFEPNPNKTFNRGYTDYNLGKDNLGSIYTPKSIGEPIGKVANCTKDFFELSAGSAQLHNGDGICFFDSSGNLQGTFINRIEENKIYPQRIDLIRKGVFLYRNYDHIFTKLLAKTPWRRKISVKMELSETPDGISLKVIDEDNNIAIQEIAVEKQPANNLELAKQTTTKQLNKLGESIFQCKHIQYNLSKDYFFTAATINKLRRDAVNDLLKTRENNRIIEKSRFNNNKSTIYPKRFLDYTANILNQKAIDFYREHGSEITEMAAESGIDIAGRTLMRTKYCIRKQLGLCKNSVNNPAEPLFLQNEKADRFKVSFTCGNCGMIITTA